MEKLTYEELDLIMRRVTDPAARKSASHVCKEWWILERMTRSSLRLFNLDYLPRLLARYPNLTTFETNKPISDDYLELVSQSCPNLESIKLGAVPSSTPAFTRDREAILRERRKKRGRGDQVGEDEQVGDKGLCALVNGCPKLSKVVIIKREVGMVGVMAMITSGLTHLELVYCSFFWDKVLDAIGSSTCPIRVLSLQGCSSSYFRMSYLAMRTEGMVGFMAMITSAARNLTHLELGNCSWVSDKILEVIGSSSCLIRVLRLGGYSITDAGLSFLANGACSETIKQLRLTSCRQITDEGVSELCKKMSVLEELDLANCVKLTDVAGLAISAIPTLKKLNLASTFMAFRSKVTEETFVAIAKNCVNLEELSLDSVTAVTTSAIVAFMGHECLRSLQLTDCLRLRNDFKESSLDCLALLCPSLESIVVHECWRKRLLRELHKTTVSRFLWFVDCRCRSDY